MKFSNYYKEEFEYTEKLFVPDDKWKHANFDPSVFKKQVTSANLTPKQIEKMIYLRNMQMMDLEQEIFTLQLLQGKDRKDTDSFKFEVGKKSKH